MVFHGWNCTVQTSEFWHDWSQLEFELCWWIPLTILPSLGCLCWGLYRTSHGCPSLIRLTSDIWIPKGILIAYSTFQLLDNSIEHHAHSETLDDTNTDILHTLWVHKICDHLSQFPLQNVYLLWQPDEWHQLLFCLVEDLLHRIIKYLKARNVNHQFDNRLTSVPQYPDLQPFPQLWDSTKCSSWKGKEIQGIIRTVSVICTLILDCSNDNRMIVADTASDEKVMGAVLALCEFSLPVSQLTYSNLSLTALSDALTPWNMNNDVIEEQNMSKSAKPNMDEQWARESHYLRTQRIHKTSSWNGSSGVKGRKDHYNKTKEISGVPK